MLSSAGCCTATLPFVGGSVLYMVDMLDGQLAASSLDGGSLVLPNRQPQLR